MAFQTTPSNKHNDVTEALRFASLTVDGDEDGIMGYTVVPAHNDSNIDDGDLLCIEIFCIVERSNETKQDEKRG